MWDFLNANAGGIQAISSMVTAAITVILVVVTWRYVHLTQRMAEAAGAELVFHEEAEAEKWRELHAQTRLLRVLLSALPVQAKDGEAAAAQAVSWEASDVARLQRLAARLDRRAGEHAANVVAAMTWLAERLREIKEADEGAAEAWSRFPWDRWQHEIRTATGGLEAIGTIVSRKLKELPATRRRSESGGLEPEQAR